MADGKINIAVEVEGVDEMLEQAELVAKKAEELDKAVQRLAEMEINVYFSHQLG